jgi:hypothetical protein
MENTDQSVYIKQRLKQLLVVALFGSIILGTWAVFQFFVSLVVLFVECIPGTIICGLAFCALKQNFTKTNFVLIQLVIYPHAVLVAKLLAVAFGLAMLAIFGSMGLMALKKRRGRTRDRRPSGKSGARPDFGKTEGT